MDGYGMPMPLTGGGPGPMTTHIQSRVPPSGSQGPQASQVPPGFYSTNPHFAPGVSMPAVPEKPSPMATDPQKLWEINALKALASHPHTYATRASLAMACPDCDAQGVTLNYMPTDYRHGPLHWSSQLLHFAEAHGHDFPIQLRQMLPQVFQAALQEAKGPKKPKGCPLCGAPIDMNLQGPRELMCFKCGASFPPTAAKDLSSSLSGTPGTPGTPGTHHRHDGISHPPPNPHLGGYPSGPSGPPGPPPSMAHGSLPDPSIDPSIGFAPEPEVMGRVAQAGGDMVRPSKHRQGYIDLLAEMEQTQGVRKAVAKTGIDCPLCQTSGYAIKIPVGTVSYRGVTWGAHLLHNLAVHGHPLPDDVKLALKAYKRETRRAPIHDPSRHLADRGDFRPTGGDPFTHFQPQTTAENIHRFIG